LNAVGLTKDYGGFKAVDELDLVVERGELVAVLGPNGAGKTTTIEMFEGYRQRSAGELSVLGVDPGKAGRDWRARIGIVLQTASDGSDVSVRFLLRHYAKLYPRSRSVDELIGLVGLGEKADSKVASLSGGQRRRLDVALGIVGCPELLFLDEPTTGFDPEARRDFWALIKRLHAEGTTTLLTTHYLAEAEALAERVVVMNHGRVVADSSVRELQARAGDVAIVGWVDASGVAHAEETVTPGEFVARLRNQLGAEPMALTVTRPSLEDVYLELVGQASVGASADG
jgi:ABC-2 type transport system ATP-binding protein